MTWNKYRFKTYSVEDCRPLIFNDLNTPRETILVTPDNIDEFHLDKNQVDEYCKSLQTFVFANQRLDNKNKTQIGYYNGKMYNETQYELPISKLPIIITNN